MRLVVIGPSGPSPCSLQRPALPQTQDAYLKASSTDANDEFSSAIAISGDTIVVGTRWESSRATGVSAGKQANNSREDAGAAYAFLRTGSNGSQQAFLKAPNTGAGDTFGCSVAVSGDIVVGAPGKGGSSFGVNSGLQLDDDMPSSGAA